MADDAELAWALKASLELHNLKLAEAAQLEEAVRISLAEELPPVLQTPSTSDALEPPHNRPKRPARARKQRLQSSHGPTPDDQPHPPPAQPARRLTRQVPRPAVPPSQRAGEHLPGDVAWWPA